MKCNVLHYREHFSHLRLILKKAWLGCCLLISMLPFAASAASVPPGSFLLYPANSTPELVREVDREPVVAERFKKHFGISSTGELELALAQLHLVRLATPKLLPVWYVHTLRGAEFMGYKMRNVPAGTMVFADQKNVPILIAECGNPIGVVSLPPAKSVAHNQFDLAPAFNAQFTPLSPQPYTPLTTPTRIADLEIPTYVNALPLRPPGLAESHVSGLPFTGALALPFFFKGGGGGISFLGASPPPQFSSGGQSPLGLVPEGGLLSLLGGMTLPLFLANKVRKQLRKVPG